MSELHWLAAIRARVDKADTVLFMHTGGSSSLFAYPDVFVEREA
jgi:1-aminocyclopropane-1-carboxylate deaminase/D-cysteine desulfhydrase-like pyridoxal-dependent ACC family enzyme